MLPGTRIITVDPELGRVALLLLQQSQPFPAPDNFNLRDATFRVVVPIRFNNVPPEGVSEVADDSTAASSWNATRPTAGARLPASPGGASGARAAERDHAHAGRLRRGEAPGDGAQRRASATTD